MENSVVGSLLRNRRFGSYVDANYGMKSVATPPRKVAVKKRKMLETNDLCGEEDGWFVVMISWARIVVCFVSMMFTTFLWAMIMVVLLPWPYQRIRQGNIYGHVTGKMLLYVLANHLRIDRSNPTAAIESMKEAANAIVKNDLSLIIFPEGTRSKNGRLLPFKKGFVNLALQTRLPIVPIVLTGTHRAWRKGSLHVRPAPLTVRYLPPIQTDDWAPEKLGDYVRLVQDVYVKNLPESQRPSESSDIVGSYRTLGS